MDLSGFQSYRGYFYRVGANYSPAGEWRGTVDIRQQRWDGTVETLVSNKDVLGDFSSEDSARSAADAYARVIIDEKKFSDD
jgi:hypothetical protein